MLPRIFGSSNGAALTRDSLGGVVRSVLAASSACSSSHGRAATQAWVQANPLSLQGSPPYLRTRTMSTEVSPTQKQQQLFAEMQSVRRMLLLRDPHFWCTEPYFSAHGAHLVPIEERSRHSHFALSHTAGSLTGPELANIIEAQASNAMQQYPRGEGWGGFGRHRQLQHQQDTGGLRPIAAWNSTQVPLELVSAGAPDIRRP
uniref:Uncharacterized protein n=1 Tax=Dunaliella tertiolecta TaxID=3047 RepID=A0A7S3R3X4_DUNTE